MSSAWNSCSLPCGCAPRVRELARVLHGGPLESPPDAVEVVRDVQQGGQKLLGLLEAAEDARLDDVRGSLPARVVFGPSLRFQPAGGQFDDLGACRHWSLRHPCQESLPAME